jgi:hypothetical protein
MSKLTRTNAIIPLPSVGDLSAKIGRPVEITVINSVAMAAAWEPGGGSAFGVIVDADAEQASIAVMHGGLVGTIKVKLVEAVLPGALLYAAQNNGVIGFADRGEETFAGPTYICAQALEAGVEGEMVEAVLFRPEAITFV